MQALQRFALVILTALTALTSAFAQKTLVYEDIIKVYNKGLELYDKEKYGSAQHEFEEFMKVNTDPVMASQAYYYAAACALELNRPAGIDNLKNYLDKYPEGNKVNDANFKLGTYFLRNKEFRQASRYLKAVDITMLNEADQDAAWFGRGYSNFQVEKFDEAKDDFGHLVNKTGSKYWVQANYYYGFIAYQSGDYKNALTSFERIKDKEMRVVKLYITQIYYAQGHYTRAIEYADTIEYAPIRKELHFIIGKSYYQLGQFEKALPYMQEVENSTTLLPTEIYQVAYTYYANKDYTHAQQNFSLIAAAKDSLAQVASWNLADCFIKLNKKMNARNAFYEASRLSFDKKIQEDAAFNYAKLSFELSFQQEALTSLRNFIQTYPESEYGDEAKGLIAEVFLTTKNYKDAAAILETVKNLNEQGRGAYQKITYFRGEELYLNKQFDEAFDYFEKSLKYTNDRSLTAMAYFWQGEINYKKGDLTKAIELYNRFLDNPQSSQTKFRNLAYYNLGYCYFKKENYGNALNYFRKYIEEENIYKSGEKVYLDAQMRLADCYFISRNYEKALTAYGYIIDKKAPNSDYAYYQRGTIFGLMGNNEAKIRELKRITEKYPNSIYVDDAIYELAQVYMQQERYSEAIRYFNYLIADFGGNVYVKKSYLHLGLVYYALKDQDKSIQSFKKVVEMYPETGEAQEALEGIKAIYADRGEPDVYIEYLRTVPMRNMDVAAEDSFLYASAFKRYGNVDCNVSIRDFDKYLKSFSGGRFALQAHFYKAECLNKLKDYDKALVDYQFVITQSPNEFAEWSARQVASIFFVRKDYEQAYPQYVTLEALAKTKDNYQFALIGQMKCLVKLNRLPEAKIVSQKLLRTDNANKDALAEANLVIAKVAVSDNQADSALPHLQYVIRESKNVLGAEATYLLAEVQFGQEKLDESEKTILALNEKFSAYEDWVARGFILLGDIYVERKDPFQAKAILQSVIDNYKGGDQTIPAKAQEKLGLIP